MIIAKVKRWGNSLGIIIPKEEADKMEIDQGDEIAVEIMKKENPLRELFGAGKDSPVTEKEFQKFRKEFNVSKWFE